MLYADQEVLLLDKNIDVIRAWECLINRAPSEIRDLPTFTENTNIDEQDLPEDVKCLIGFWLSHAVGAKCKMYRARDDRWTSPWGSETKKKLSLIAGQIKHWRAVCGDYTACENERATWFIDPPYQGCGSGSYRFFKVDHFALASWAKSRIGQVICCDRADASWLPFSPLTPYRGARKTYIEGVYHRPSEQAPRP